MIKHTTTATKLKNRRPLARYTIKCIIRVTDTLPKKVMRYRYRYMCIVVPGRSF